MQFNFDQWLLHLEVFFSNMSTGDRAQIRLLAWLWVQQPWEGTGAAWFRPAFFQDYSVPQHTFWAKVALMPALENS